MIVSMIVSVLVDSKYAKINNQIDFAYFKTSNLHIFIFAIFHK